MVVRDERDKRGRSSQKPGGHPGQPVKAFLWGGIEQSGLAEGCQPVGAGEQTMGHNPRRPICYQRLKLAFDGSVGSSGRGGYDPESPPKGEATAWPELRKKEARQK